ncbi:hypothetical protein NKI77_26510 [Mesorhizobium opportunistum]|uniref:Uncharacterized protein n=1 Tax=Mesorhizobium opportunistum TaxID=593909 RepID=A0ABV1YDC5_9HYPH|nr:hypothetical protein [Mesorhizobium sp.]TIN97650.1 MAG: hypothetical protein E5Y06_05290 [Mesorhizobium sp.]TJU98912.1 MAG: hypothetical protein E5Y08_12360 [Mesorhizobium sp.]TJV14584.1 MAG: hypothetical protein E5Y07_26000 [Mesorhizobium sp.]
MVKKTIRKIELFAIHAHNFGSSSYDDLFKKLSDLPAERRVVTVSGVVIGFPIVKKVADQYFLQATEGDPDAAALVFNRDTGTTRETDLSRGEMLSQATHLLVSASNRRASIEYSRRGIKAVSIGPAIEGIISKNYNNLKNLRLEFAPVTTKSFISQIKQFDRIRAASLRVLKPNASWTDHYTDLSDLLDESNGGKVEIDVRANRGESLRKTKGIVKVIKDVTRDEQPYLDAATVTGTRADETNETTIRADRHITHTRVPVDADDAGVPVAESVQGALSNFLSRFIQT